MKKLLLLLWVCLSTSVCSAQWLENFDGKKMNDLSDGSKHGCWASHKAALTDVLDGAAYNSKILEVLINNGGDAYVWTPFITMKGSSEGALEQGFKVKILTLNNRSDEKDESYMYSFDAKLIDPNNKTVALYTYNVTGNYNGYFTVLAPVGYKGDLGLLLQNFKIATNNPKGNTLRVLFDDFYVANGTLSVEPCIGVKGGGDMDPGDALPVTLINFYAKKQTLYWETATEQNSEYFSVQSSRDGMTFKELGKVKAAGTSNSKLLYQFVVGDQPGTTYYRLKSVDNDETFEYSKTIVIANSNGTKRFGPFTIDAAEVVKEVLIYNTNGGLVKKVLSPENFPSIEGGRPYIVRLVTDLQIHSKFLIVK